ncbi:MAG: hypothetical protein RDV48_12635 [Candidatus Eremiobacteraeota bacterium]|nr:hypothetical protein [Candidatus Eremiobacteraeota bacterium]
MTLSRNKKATFMLPEGLLEEMHEVVNTGLARSVSSLVRQALEQRLRQLREERLRKEFEQAAGDSEFMNDLEGTMSVFQDADGETARLIKE